MLQHEPEFPHAGAMAFRIGTAEPVRIQRRNADGSALVTRHRRLPGGGIAVLTGASANSTLAMAELFPDPESAAHGSVKRASKARRSRAKGKR